MLELRPSCEHCDADLPPASAACNTWRALYLGIGTFKQDLMAHIHLENNILFENAEAEAVRPRG